MHDEQQYRVHRRVGSNVRHGRGLVSNSRRPLSRAVLLGCFGVQGCNAPTPHVVGGKQKAQNSTACMSNACCTVILAYSLPERLLHRPKATPQQLIGVYQPEPSNFCMPACLKGLALWREVWLSPVKAVGASADSLLRLPRTQATATHDFSPVFRTKNLNTSFNMQPAQ